MHWQIITIMLKNPTNHNTEQRSKQTHYQCRELRHCADQY